MPFIVHCPGCKARLKAPEALAGKTIKCPGCSQPVHIKAPAAPAPPARPRAAPPPAQQPVLDELEEVEDEVDPRVKAREERAAPGRKAPPRRDEEVVADAVEELDAVEEVGEVEEAEEERPRKQKAVPSGPSDPDERTKAMLLYLLQLVGLGIVSIILWVMKRKESRFIDHHGKNLLNFNITMILIMVGLFAVSCPVGIFVHWIGWVALGILSLGLVLGAIILTVIAALKAKNGVWYTYPVALRLLK
jgi:uncharacterized Tic20 family protein